MMHKEMGMDMSAGKGKTMDARKKQPKAAETTMNECTMIDYKAPKPNCGYLDARKKVAKPAGTTKNESTMM